MLNDDGESVYSASVYSAIPVQVEFSSFHEDDDDDISIVSLDNKYQAKQDSHHHNNNSSSNNNNNNNGFIFGLRMGFSSQFIMGSIVLFGYHDEFSAAMTSTQGVVLVTAAMCAITVIMTLLSNKLHTCLKKKQSSSSSSSIPPGRYQEQPLLQTSTTTSEQDYHLYYGTLLGMFLGWILFDLIMENGLTILGIHSAVSLVGYLYLRRRSRENMLSSSKRRRLPSPSSGRRSPVSDDLLRSLDLA